MADTERYIACQFDLPFQIPLPDTCKEIPELLIEDVVPSAINTRLCAPKTQGLGLMGEIDGPDPYGRSLYSTVAVRFRLADFTDETGKRDDIKLVESAVHSVNRLIDAYRWFFKKSYLHKVKYRDLIHFTIFEVKDGRAENSQLRSYTNGPLIMGHGKKLERLDEFRTMLKNFVSLTFEAEILLEIDSYIRTERYNLAIIFTAILFETWLKQDLKNELKGRGLSEADIKSEFMSGKGPRGIWDIAYNLVRKHYGLRFTDSDPGLNWRENCLNIRNALIHGEATEATLEQAQAARSSIFVAKL
jgi:hypothetical protein